MANLTIPRTLIVLIALAAPTVSGFSHPSAAVVPVSSRPPRPSRSLGRRTATSLDMGNGASSGGGPPSGSTKECFAGKSVLLTGASRGLGSSLAARLASCGVSELVLSGRDSDALDGVREECLRLGPDVKVRVIPCDLGDR